MYEKYYSKIFIYALINFYLFQVISTWGVRNKIDFLSLSYTRHAEDVRHVRNFLLWILWYILCVLSELFILPAIPFIKNFLSFLQARAYLSKLGALNQTQIFAKIENIEVGCIISHLTSNSQILCIFLDFFLTYHFLLSHVIFQGLTHFDEILQEADGIILSRGNLGVDLPPEKVDFHTWSQYDKTIWVLHGNFGCHALAYECILAN